MCRCFHVHLGGSGHICLFIAGSYAEPYTGQVCSLQSAYGMPIHVISFLIYGMPVPCTSLYSISC